MHNNKKIKQILIIFDVIVQALFILITLSSLSNIFSALSIYGLYSVIFFITIGFISGGILSKPFLTTFDIL